MGYNIKPLSVKHFIEDQSIRLPRFQRKQTWSDKKNFLLAVSIFKGYPIGVTILNLENRNGIMTKWLLDGRQRRNALSIINSDPEKIYYWAKAYLGFKNTDQINDIGEKFWRVVNDYIESDTIQENIEDEEDNNTTVDDEFNEANNIINGLRLLYRVIKVCHNTNNLGTQLTRKFDFSTYFSNIEYRIIVNGVRKLSSAKLKTFINRYIHDSRTDQKDFYDKDTFCEYYLSKFQLVNENSKIAFRNRVDQIWEDLAERIKVIESIDEALLATNIGIIEIKDISTTDAQKIFNIINTGGSPLSAAEILSAKPTWNLLVRDPSEELILKKNALYTEIRTSVTDVVRWDIPATFLSRINNPNLLFPKFDSDQLERKISLGFKIMAGIFVGGVKKENIDLLNSHPVVSNIIVYEDFVDKFNKMISILIADSFFTFVLTWKKSIMELLSDSVMLNFVILLYLEFVKRGCPDGGSALTKFKKNSFILFDKMVYEYSKRIWRGSSDSTIAKNIAAHIRGDDVFTEITEVEWQNLIDDIFTNSQIDRVAVNQQSVTPILYYHYFLLETRGPENVLSIEVDHILPKAVLGDKVNLLHNLANLQLLPKKVNISKGSKRLSQITDPWLKTEILKYSGISEGEYLTFSDVRNYGALKNKRYPKFIEAFIEKRGHKLEN